MPAATYDAIIIGAGHNGIAFGAYLAKSGWEVAIFETRGEDGGPPPALPARRRMGSV